MMFKAITFRHAEFISDSQSSARIVENQLMKPRFMFQTKPQYLHPCRQVQDDNLGHIMVNGKLT